MYDLRRLPTTPTLVLALLLAPMACGDDTPTDPAPGDPVIIDLTTDPSFSQDDVTIAAGTTVRWLNLADVGHTVTPDGHSEWTRWVTDMAGETFEHTFESPGTFPYFCEPHVGLGMTGVIRVE